MKITMGVDDAGRAALVAETIEALKFTAPKIDIVHVTESWSDAPYSTLQSQSPDLVTRYFEIIENEAKGLLTTVRSDLEQRGFKGTRTHHLQGFVTNQLLQHAQDTGASLLAVGSSGKGPIEAIMVGSVTRKAAIGSDRTLLVAKQPVNKSKPLKAVLATDHSPYAKRFIEEFGRLAPRGIGELVVTTVYPAEMIKAMSSVAGHFKADVGGWLRSELENANQKVCKQLSAIGATCKSRVESASNVSDKLADIMREEKADLLIVGAQGRGFIERMTVGSVALDQVMKRHYSVLVVRA